MNNWREKVSTFFEIGIPILWFCISIVLIIAGYAKEGLILQAIALTYINISLAKTESTLSGLKLELRILELKREIYALFGQEKKL